MAPRKKVPPPAPSLSPEQAIELIQRQIDAGEKLLPPRYGMEDNDESISRWRTVTDGILKRYDPSWASAFFNAQHSFSMDSGGLKCQLAKLRAFVDLLKLQISHPGPQTEPEPSPAPRMPTSIRVTGAHARVNVNSVDNSSNASLVVPAGFWAELDAAVQRVSEPARAELARRAAAMKEAHGKPSFRERWTDFMANAANHVTVLGSSVFAKLGDLLG